MIRRQGITSNMPLKRVKIAITWSLCIGKWWSSSLRRWVCAVFASSTSFVFRSLGGPRTWGGREGGSYSMSLAKHVRMTQSCQVSFPVPHRFQYDINTSCILDLNDQSRKVYAARWIYQSFEDILDFWGMQ
jgi:hypothetical protein